MILRPGRARARSLHGVRILTLVAVLLTVTACGAAEPERRAAPPPRTWPTAADTGASGTLEPVGIQELKVAGATLKNVDVDGPVVVSADDVTIRNVRVRSNAPFGILTYGQRTVIEDVTVEGTAGSTVAGIGTNGGSFTARRVDVSGSEDGVRLSGGSALEDSWVHDLAGGPDAHFDAVTADGFTGWRIVGNRIENPHPQTAVIWVGDARGPASDGLVEDNFLSGGGYVIYAGPGTDAGIRIVNNVFSTETYPQGGHWGPVTGWTSSHNVWSKNTWADGSRRHKAVAP